MRRRGHDFGEEIVVENSGRVGAVTKRSSRNTRKVLVIVFVWLATVVFGISFGLYVGWQWPQYNYRSVELSGRKVMDISVLIDADAPVWDSENGVGDFVRKSHSFDNGDPMRVSILERVSVHTLTHVDANSHFLEHDLQTVDELDLNTLQGRAFVVDLASYISSPGSSHSHQMTWEFLDSLPEHILPRNETRLLFRTSASVQNLLQKKQFDRTYPSFSLSGAKWILNNTHAKLIGVDYLSACNYPDGITCHREFFSQSTILLEGLNLTAIESGAYELRCLPLKLAAEGAFARAILISL
mmetsp:Transcript_3030/g.5359  ORF Transcript_3030/g.5359 Transcript_3030/m.5359 type:complete len:298 (-) Transcript_3030:62-955(-)